jgi:hypothetical protein
LIVLEGHTVADSLLDVLVQAGVRRIYGLVGDSLNAFSDAVRRSGGAAKGGIDWVHVHNEEGAAFAASAEAQLTGALAVCAGSCGPGNTHLIQGVMDANRSGAPVLVLASHIISREIGTGYFQETDPQALFAQTSGPDVGPLLAVVGETVTSGGHPVRLEHTARAELKNFILSDKQHDTVNRDIELRDLYNSEDPFKLAPLLPGCVPVPAQRQPGLLRQPGRQDRLAAKRSGRAPADRVPAR